MKQLLIIITPLLIPKKIYNLKKMSNDIEKDCVN